MFSEIKWRLVSAITAGVMLLAVHAFEWSIVDRITPFLYLPLAGAVWWVVIGVGLASLTSLTKIRTIGIRAFVPPAVIALSVSIVTLVPFTDLWLKLDYSLHKKERNAIVQRILAGNLTSNVSHNTRLIALGDAYPLVSMGGNEVVVEEHNGHTYVLFYTFRGVLDNYSGFLYVSDGGSPSLFADLNEQATTQVISLEENWYYASHR